MKKNLAVVVTIFLIPFIGFSQTGSNLLWVKADANVYSDAGTIISGLNNSWRFTVATINSTQTSLTSFTAISINKKVYLKWETATEANNNYFTVEKSNDGNNYENIGVVVERKKSSSVSTYSLVDKNPYSCTSYYRLKQTDSDGQISYSLIKKANITSDENSQIKIYPNPMADQLIIEGDESELIDFKIYNAVGIEVKLIERIIDKGRKNIIHLDISTLRQGLYVVETKTTSTKVYKQ